MKPQWFVFAVAFALVASPVLAAEFQVIVHNSNPATSITKVALQDYYLGKATRWSNGMALVPVDLDEQSAIRAAFSKNVLSKTVANVKSYWLTIVFAGRGVPPVELDSEEKVIDAVKRNKGSIGYISATTALPSGVKALKIE